MCLALLLNTTFIYAGSICLDIVFSGLSLIRFLFVSGCKETVSCETQGTKQTAWLHDSSSERQGMVTVSLSQWFSIISLNHILHGILWFCGIS